MVLARELTEREWGVLAGYYGEIEQLHRFLDAHPNLEDLAQPNRENLDEWGFADELRGGVMHSTAAVLAALGVPQQEIDELIETWGPR